MTGEAPLPTEIQHKAHYLRIREAAHLLDGELERDHLPQESLARFIELEVGLRDFHDSHPVGWLGLSTDQRYGVIAAELILANTVPLAARDLEWLIYRARRSDWRGGSTLATEVPELVALWQIWSAAPPVDQADDWDGFDPEPADRYEGLPDHFDEACAVLVEILDAALAVGQ